MQIEEFLTKTTIVTVLAVFGLVISILATYLQFRSKRRLIETETERSIVQVLDIIADGMAEKENLLPGEVKADVFLFDKNKEILKQIISSRKNRDLKNKEIQSGKQQGIVGKVLSEQRPVWFNFTGLNQEIETPSTFTVQEKELLKDTKSVLAVPIFHPKTNDSAGVLFVYSKEKKLDANTEQFGKELATTSASVISKMLDRADKLPT